MASRRDNKNIKSDTNETPQEEIMSVSEITEDVVNEINGDDNTDNVNEGSEETSTDNVNEETDENAEPVEDNRDPFIKLEDVPTFEGQVNPAFKPIAYGLVYQITTFRNSYLDAIEALAAAAFDGSKENVLALAEKYKDRNPLISDMVNTFTAAEAAFNDALNKLTETVKESANIKSLSDEERDTLQKDAQSLFGEINNAINGLKEFEVRSPNSIKAAVDYVEQMPPLPAYGKKKGGTVKIGEGISRPRLGGGYVKVAGKSYDSFSKALPAITSAVGRKVLAPEVHKAWYDAAGQDDWSKISPNTPVAFTFFGTEIEIMRKS